MPPSPASANHRLDQAGTPLGKRAAERSGEFTVDILAASRHTESSDQCPPQSIAERVRSVRDSALGADFAIPARASSVCRIR